MYLTNAFSLNMVPSGFDGTIDVTPVEPAAATDMISSGMLESAIGHEDLANLLGVPCARLTVTLGHGDTALVAQYRGPRLPTGATALPEGATIEFYIVNVGGKE